jgi:hypothetical protein
MAAESTVRTRSELVRLLEERGIPFELIESGPAWAVVTPTLAARILGTGVGEENAFWVPPASEWKPGGWNARGWNAGGQRTWIAPEAGPSGFFFTADGSAWSVPPELDPGNYGPAAADPGWRAWQTELTARTAAGSARRIRIRRGLRLEEAAGSPRSFILRFRHALENLDASPLDRQVGLWGLIQLPCDEPSTIFLSLRKPGSALTPYFGETPPLDVGDEGKLAWLRVRGGARFKAGMSPDAFGGTMGFIRRSRLPGGGKSSLLFTAMSFLAEPAETYVDRSPGSVSQGGNGDAAQVYGDPGTGALAFCEIEAHASAPRLAPGETAAQEILITIGSCEEKDLGGALGLPGRTAPGLIPPPRRTRR